MSVRDYLKDLEYVGRGMKQDLIDTVVGITASDDPAKVSGDVNDIAKTVTGNLSTDSIGAALGIYNTILSVADARSERIEEHVEGAEERGHELARETLAGLSSHGPVNLTALRGVSDACEGGVPDIEDLANDEYVDAFESGRIALEETTRPSAFGEIREQRQALNRGYRSEVSTECEGAWGHPSAHAAREAGLLQPLSASTLDAAPAAAQHPTETTPSPSAEASQAIADQRPRAEQTGGFQPQGETDPSPNADSEETRPEAGTRNGPFVTGASDLKHDDQPTDATAIEEPASGYADDLETHLYEPTGTTPSGAEPSLEAESEPTPVAQEPAAGADEPYVTGDGDLAAQDHGHAAWVDAEIAEDAAISASAEAVHEPNGFDDPETYASDGDMAALTEAYDWEAEQFDEGATLFDEPVPDATVITPEQPVTVPDAAVREPEEPEV